MCIRDREIVGEDRETSEKKVSDGVVTNRFGSRAQSVREYRLTDSRNSSSAGDGVLGRETGVLTRRGASRGTVPNKGGSGVAASVLCWIGTVGTGSMDGPGAT